MEKVGKQKEDKIIIGIGILMAVLAVLLIFANLLGKKNLELPGGAITQMPRIRREIARDSSIFNLCVRCAGSNYTMWIPYDADIQQDAIKGSIKGVTYFITTSAEDKEVILQDTIPQKLYYSSLGEKEHTKLLSLQEGYFYGNYGFYAIQSLNIRSSLRSQQQYLFTYGIGAEDGVVIYITTVAGATRDIESAYALLTSLAENVSSFAETSKEVQEAVILGVLEEDAEEETAIEQVQSSIPSSEDAATALLLEILLEKNITKPVTDGYLVMMWENYTTDPTELHVYAPDGTELTRLVSESDGGFYVYPVTGMVAGAYRFQGTTKSALVDVYIDVFEKEEYDALFHN